MILYYIMYKGILAEKKGAFVSIAILAAVFIAIYGNYNYVFAAEKQFKSEEDLIDETRANIEKHLNDQPQKKGPAVVRELPKVKTTEAKTPEKPIIAEETLPKEEIQAITKDEPAATEEKLPPNDETSAVKKEEQPAAKEDTIAEKKEAVPPDITSVTLPNYPAGNNANQQPSAKEVEMSPKTKKVIMGPGVEEPVLKKMDINRIGASPYYETYEGLRLLKYFTVAQRVEIYQEARPIDSYILDAFAMRYLYHNTQWNQKADYRTQIVPVFTRAYGTEITFSDPKNKEAQIRYTHDYRNIYRNYFPKYDYNDLQGIENGIKEETWDQNEILLMHSKDIEPIGWLYTSNLGYRYSTMSCKSDPVQATSNYPYYEIRHTYFGSLSLAPNPRLEYFFQGEYYKSMHLKSTYSFRPDHFMGRTELRIKSNDYKTTFVPSFSVSEDLYYPGSNKYEKYEIAYRVGRDWTKKFSTTHTLEYVGSYRDEQDNQAPLYAAGYYNPHKDKAEYVSFENRFQYNVYDRLYVQTGFDMANGINWSIFDNLGFLGGLEYYAPGIIRVDVGWRGNYYYGLQDFLSAVYFKFYLFM